MRCLVSRRSLAQDTSEKKSLNPKNFMGNTEGNMGVSPSTTGDAQSATPTRTGDAQSATPTRTTGVAQSATPTRTLALNSLSALNAYRARWQANLMNSRARNLERDENPQHMHEKTATERWEYLVEWKHHQKITDQYSRLLKEVKESRRTEGIRDKEPAQPKAKARPKAKSAGRAAPRTQAPRVA